MKRVLGILLSLLIVLSTVFPVLASSEEGAKLSAQVTVGTETASKVKRGETITITVFMQDCNMAFKSLGLTLAYDESVFEYVQTDASGNANWTCPIPDLFMNAYVAENKNLATAAMNEIDYNGVIFTINLNVKDTATFREQTIGITPIIKNGQTVIPCTATSATVEVVCNHAYSNEWTSTAEGHYKACTVEGCTAKNEEATHAWDNTCDTTCDVCGLNRTVEHSFNTTEWKADNLNHWHVCTTSGCVATTTPESHSGGTSDCKNKAVCDTCNQSYGELGGHTLTYHAGQGADHNNTGVAEHWTCDICNKYFSDAAGINETTQDDIIIGKVPHNHDSEWSYNTEQHWKECVCGDKIDVGGHHYSNTCDTTCDCGYTRTIQHSWESTYSYNENGHWIECSVCGEKQGAVENHSSGTATCQKKAQCSVCNQTYGDLVEHNYTSEVAEDKYLKSEATCKDFAVYYKSCSMCGLAGTETFNGTVKADHVFDNVCDTTCNAGCGYTRTITHQWETSYSSNDNKHWKECEICGEKKDEGTHAGGSATCKDKSVCGVCDKAFGEVAPHNFIEKEDAQYLKSAATCVEKAIYYESCSVCGIASADTFKAGEVDSSTHTGNTEVRDAVKATCTTDGYTGDTYCKDCNVKLEDGEVITKEEATHTFGDWTVTKEATATEKGSKEKVCTACEYKVVEEIPMLEDDSVQNDSNAQTPETDSPKTGDYSDYLVWFAVAALSLMIGLKCVFERKRNK